MTGEKLLVLDTVLMRHGTLDLRILVQVYKAKESELITVTFTGRIWCQPNSSSFREARDQLSADTVPLVFVSNFM